MQIRTAIVFVNDVERMRTFYRDGLGLTEIEVSPGWVRLDAGGCTLALHAIPPAIAPTVEDPPRAREDTCIKLAFFAPDVEAERARLDAAGAHMGEVKRFGDITLCDGIDPEGNVFQISSRR